jgi:pyruvate dehydrogenase E2 component (dihydrolipoamide acetyltransferase)
MTEGTLARWLKKEGEAVKSGDVIAEIETDKATMEVEAVDEGKLGRILVPAGTAGVKVNAPIAVILGEGEDVSMIKAPSASVAAPLPNPPPQAGEGTKKAVAASPSPAPAGEGRGGGSRIMATPLAKRIAAEKSLNLSGLQGSGPYGRIIKRDIDNARPVSATRAPAVASSAGPVVTNPLGQAFTALPNNNVKKVTARRLLESKQTIPHFYLSVDCRIDQLLAMRRRINETGVKVSVNDFVIRAVALSLREIPAANASWTEDAVLQFTDVDVSVAVATPNGLITPIVKKADGKGLAAISAEMKDLAERARLGKLKPEEFMGGGFTISNLGMFGIKEFAAIINPPQSCILAVGAGDQRPVVVDGRIEVATVMTCTLSVDHRSVDGAVGAQFLGAFKKRIEDPALMLL